MAARPTRSRGPRNSWRRARRRYRALEPRVQRQRLYALLARHGDDGDTIRRAVELKAPLESGAEA